VEDVIFFPELPHQNIPYAIKQMIAHEVEMEIMRRKEGPATTTMTTNIDKNVENVQTQPPEEQVILFIFSEF
jgi:hypothetical protein